MSDHESKAAIRHEVIRTWVEEREGHPAVVRASHDRDGSGILRIDFGEEDETLERIEWNEFFRIFDENRLRFLYQEKTADGDVSRFFKFIER